jgi:hypothetical protein
LKSSANLDFVAGEASLTPYNCRDKASVKKGETRRADDIEVVAPYSNLAGLLTLDAGALSQLDAIHTATLKAKATAPPAYD